MPELLSLASIADRYACISPLQLVDSTRLQLCNTAAKEQAKAPSSPMPVANVPIQYPLALRLHLNGYAAVAGQVLGKHADNKPEQA